MTKDHWVQLLVGVGGLLAFGGGAVAAAAWIHAHSSPVTLSCAELDEEPSGLVFRLEGCEADLSDVAVEEAGTGWVSALYVPLRAGGSTEPAHVVLRTERPELLRWMRNEGAPVDEAIVRWAGPRTFVAVDAGPLGRPKGISESDVASLLRGEAPRFVILDEDGSLFGWWAFAGILGVVAAMCAVIVVLVVRSIRRHRAKKREAGEPAAA